MKLKTKIDELKVSPVIGVIFMTLITLILAAVITGFVFGLGEQNQYYKIIPEDSNEDFLLVKIISYNNSPLANVSLKVMEHGEGRLLTGPRKTNESGYAILQIPHGYDEYFDIVGEYDEVIYTKTIDKRSPLVKSESYLGSLGIQIIVGIIVAYSSYLFGMKTERKRKKAPGKDEDKEKSEDDMIREHQQ
ncbi:MAG: type IV pilin N-terminal domain-containing protein [Euryarchaeota archaeon]|nr:type IV pilin N-terminal domain-containing protein [Euryarchaeota archaeon]